MEKQREKTVSLTANQLRDIAKKPELATAIAQQIDASEEMVRGNTLFKVAVMLTTMKESENKK